MGQLQSTKVPVADERMMLTMARLQLTESDMVKLYKRFLKSDKKFLSNGGTISREEFYEAIDEKNSALGDAIFNLIDEDNSGVLDFSEYVEALGKFCVLGKEELLRFCFNVFDEDRSGIIEGEELSKLMTLLHEDSQTSNIKNLLSNLKLSDDGKLDFEEFKVLAAMAPSLLYPAFRIQNNMKIYTMGEVWWRNKTLQLKQAKKEVEKQLNDVQGESLQAKENAEESRELTTKKREEVSIKIRMGCLQYMLCPCRRDKYLIKAPIVISSSEDSDSEMCHPRIEVQERNKKLKEDARLAEMYANLYPIKKTIKPNIVAVGERKRLSQEERLERARKRRLRDMQAHPTRKHNRSQ